MRLTRSERNRSVLKALGGLWLAACKFFGCTKSANRRSCSVHCDARRLNVGQRTISGRPLAERKPLRRSSCIEANRTNPTLPIRIAVR